MDSQYASFTPYTGKTSSPKKRAFLLLVVFLLIVATAIFLGNYFLNAQSPAPDGQNATPTQSAAATATPAEEVSPTETLSPSPTNSASPSPTQTAKKSLTIEVLNGSGTGGAAGDAARLLRAAGYTVSSTGNADTFDYTRTVIQLKKSKNSFAAQLKKDLSAEYTVDPTVQTLAESAQTDAIVIVGEK